MPDNYAKFKYAPYCSLSTLAHVYPIAEGVWESTNEGGDVNRLSDDDFHRRCRSIANADNGEGVYSIVAPTELGVVRRFALNAEEKTVTLEGFEHDIDLAEFRKMAVRTNKDGKIIASLAASLTDQWNKCMESGDADDHLQDIREMAQAYADSKDKFELYDHHMYGLAVTEANDGLDFMGLMAKISAIGHPEGPVHKRFPLTDAVDGWMEVREIPTYMQGGVRFAFDLFMRDMLGDFPDDRVTMVFAQHGDVQYSEELEKAGFELAGMLPPFDGKNVLPGYKSGDVAFHRAKGVDVVVFSDFMGTYAYAWPTEEGGKYQIPEMTFKLGL